LKDIKQTAVTAESVIQDEGITKTATKNLLCKF